MRYFKQMEGLRGIAALWVTMFHFVLYLNVCKKVSFGAVQPILLSGYFGVDIFFVLSGFIIHAKYNNFISDGTNFIKNYKDFL